LPSLQFDSGQLGRGFGLRINVLSTLQGRVKAWSNTVISS
jgi:hypothetical protein